MDGRASLPHAVLVECARRAVRDQPSRATEAARELADEYRRALFTDVINATGVLLHTNLGRAPLGLARGDRAMNLEFDLVTGGRGSRHDPISRLVALTTGAEAAAVVNNNAAAVMLVLATHARERDVVVSRGESVEIGGGFRIPEVMEQSGARLVDVGTTNKTRLRDYERAISARRNDVALALKVHPSNFAMTGFIGAATVKELSSLPVPLVVDVGSGLLDNQVPWLHGRMADIPSWLSHEPSVASSLADGAALVTFSGDKLMGGPQCGIIAGRRDLVEACRAHPLMRALRPGADTLAALQHVLLALIDRSACDSIPFWAMVATPTTVLEDRARAIVDRVPAEIGASVEPLHSIVGAGSAPDARLDSAGIALPGDHRAHLRSQQVPIVARTREDRTLIDMRTVREADDHLVAGALSTITTGQ